MELLKHPVNENKVNFRINQSEEKNSKNQSKFGTGRNRTRIELKLNKIFKIN